VTCSRDETFDESHERRGAALAFFHPLFPFAPPEADTPIPESDKTKLASSHESAERWRFLVALALLALDHL
jgi:hypothetical protein